jgi:predicted lipid-binding transport protein (Tim44 family)
MPGFSQLIKLALVFGSVAVNASPKFNNARPRTFEIRAPQAPAPAAAPAPGAPAPPAPAPAPAAAGNLTDVDILQL